MRNEALIQGVMEALNSVIGSYDKVALHEPSFKGNEWRYVKDCIDSGWVSSVGMYVRKLEEELQTYTGIRHAIAVVNGTAALHICLQLSGVTRDDEVLIPALTFVATANAVKYCGAIPHFLDVDDRTLGLDAGILQDYLQDIAEIRGDHCYNKLTGRRIKAIVPMHTFGHPVSMDTLCSIAEGYGISVIEDAAEALGSYFRNKHVGSWGLLSALSFNGNKIVTTGGGGAILTNDDSLAQQARHLTTTAKLSHPWNYIHDQIGYNYRMPNLNAALGCAQLEQLPEFLERKRKLAQKYKEAFQTVSGIQFIEECENVQSNYWLNALLLDKGYEDQLNYLLEETNANRLMTRPAWTLLNTLEMYKNCPQMNLVNSESLVKRLLNIPSSAILGE